MPERALLTEIWDDDWIVELSPNQKLLFIYLWSNSHCNQAGLYHITPKRISDETGLEKAAIPELLNSLAPKVIWYSGENLVWVKSFIKRQSKSPKFLAAAAKSLTTIHHNGAISELLEYNFQRYSISIPYEYYMNRPSILPASASVSASVSASGSLFSGSLFSLEELNAALSALKPGVDRLVDHETIKQKLAEIGVARGYEVQSEVTTNKGRIDLCWLNNKGEIAAAFEIDFLTPRGKSISKLKASGCPDAFIVLRKGKAKAEHFSSFLDQELAEVSTLYEANIGRLTQRIGEQLKDIVDTYPPGWFKEALDEALKSNARNLRYILSILERWKIEGFKSKKGTKNGEQIAAHQRGTKQPSRERYRQSLNR